MTWELPPGFSAAGGHCGIKSDRPDLGVLLCDVPLSWAGVFTRNAAAAAPVLACREAYGREVRALVVNSGNANACTGSSGVEAVARTKEAAATVLGCQADEILVASTGPIGVPLTVELIEAALPDLVAGSGPDANDFAHSILTTDTVAKIATADAGDAKVVGVAKGAAMIAPNMATMLGFVMTDAAVSKGALQGIVAGAVDLSFNRISVDACESTNDSVFLLSSGQTPCSEDELRAAVTSVCRSLAEMIVRDAEGASKFVRVNVFGASDDAAATQLGRAVAASDLWRAAAGGNDPNWGRILSALGTSDRTLGIDKVSVAIGGEVLFSNGEPCGDRNKALHAMTQPEFQVDCVVGDGPGTSEILTCDLTPDYVKLNAEGAT